MNQVNLAPKNVLPSSLLLVDDDERFRERMARALSDRGVSVSLAGDASEALRQLSERQFDAAVTDLKMPGPNGLVLIKEIMTRSPDTRVVVLTGYGTIATAVEAMRLGAIDYLVKPCHADQLLQAFTEGESLREPDVEEAPAPSLARLEREHIERVLTECGGNVTHAARVLGIHRRTLQYKLAKFPVGR
jgi:two-component system, response regulator RegA